MTVRNPRVHMNFQGTKVTEHQWFVLDALTRYHRYTTLGGSGWVYGTNSETLRILRSLTRKGLVTATERTDSRTGDPYLEFRLTRKKG